MPAGGVPRQPVTFTYAFGHLDTWPQEPRPCLRNLDHWSQGRTIRWAGDDKESLMRILIASSSLMAVLVAAPAALGQASPVCLKDVSGMANCVFQTVAQCEAAKGLNTAAQCIPSSQITTTIGSGSGTQPGGSTRQGPRSPTPSPTR